MREPSLSLHGIEGAFYGVGAKTVIPAKVSGKFSIRYCVSLLISHSRQWMNCHTCRLVPPQTPDNINPLVFKYLEAEFAKLNSKNKLTVEELHGGKPWVADHKHWNYEAAIKATEVSSFLRHTFSADATSYTRLCTRRRLI
jgi:Cys-Gly metallodipeptidase DUG1